MKQESYDKDVQLDDLQVKVKEQEEQCESLRESNDRLKQDVFVMEMMVGEIQGKLDGLKENSDRQSLKEFFESILGDEGTLLGVQKPRRDFADGKEQWQLIERGSESMDVF